jgi:hypothetical protein
MRTASRQVTSTAGDKPATSTISGASNPYSDILPQIFEMQLERLYQRWLELETSEEFDLFIRQSSRPPYYSIGQVHLYPAHIGSLYYYYPGDLFSIYFDEDRLIYSAGYRPRIRRFVDPAAMQALLKQEILDLSRSVNPPVHLISYLLELYRTIQLDITINSRS